MSAAVRTRLEGSRDRATRNIRRCREDQERRRLAASHSFRRIARARKKSKARAEREDHGDGRRSEEVVENSPRAAQRLIPREKRDRRCRFDGGLREPLELRREGREDPDHCARQEDAPDQRVGEASGNQARPCDQRIGPTTPDERLQRNVDHPAEAREEEAVPEPSRKSSSSAALATCRASVAQESIPNDENEDRQAHRAAAVAAAQTQIPPGEQVRRRREAPRSSRQRAQSRALRSARRARSASAAAGSRDPPARSRPAGRGRPRPRHAAADSRARA